MTNIPLDDAEWKLRCVPYGQQWTCHYYEYARDVLSLRAAAARWAEVKKECETPDQIAEVLERLEKEFPVLSRPLAERLVIDCPDFPDTPWLRLHKETREYWSRQLERDMALQEPYDILALFPPPGSLQGKVEAPYVAAMSAVTEWAEFFRRTGRIPPLKIQSNGDGMEVRLHATPEDWREFFRRLGIVPFLLRPGARTRNAIETGFRTWLDENPWLYEEEGIDGRSMTNTRKPMEWLRALAVLRLSRAMPPGNAVSYRLQVQEYGNHWISESVKKWSEWRLEALEHRRELFGE